MGQGAALQIAKQPQVTVEERPCRAAQSPQITVGLSP